MVVCYNAFNKLVMLVKVWANKLFRCLVHFLGPAQAETHAASVCQSTLGLRLTLVFMHQVLSGAELRGPQQDAQGPTEEVLTEGVAAAADAAYTALTSYCLHPVRPSWSACGTALPA